MEWNNIIINSFAQKKGFTLINGDTKGVVVDTLCPGAVFYFSRWKKNLVAELERFT
jgi:hypothetical protein